MGTRSHQMKTISIFFLLAILMTTTAFAHESFDPNSWKAYKNKTIEIINVPTENPIYDSEEALIEAATYVADVVFTGSRKTKQNERGGLYTATQLETKEIIKGKLPKRFTIVEPAYVHDNVYYQYDNHAFIERKKTYRVYLIKIKNKLTPITPGQGTALVQ